MHLRGFGITATNMLSALYAISRPSVVCPSVRHTVGPVKTVEFSPYGSPIPVVLVGKF